LGCEADRAASCSASAETWSCAVIRVYFPISFTFSGSFFQPYFSENSS